MLLDDSGEYELLNIALLNQYRLTDADFRNKFRQAKPQDGESFSQFGIQITGYEEDHDRNLTNLMKQAERKGLVFNSKKCHIKQSCVSFFGNRYTPDGIKPDPDKVRDIRNMPSPQS